MDVWRRHGIPRDSKATVVPLDVLHIPRGTINSRPRETTIDLIETCARFPSIAGNPGGSSIFTIARAIRQSRCWLHIRGLWLYSPRRIRRRIREEERFGLDTGKFLCSDKSSSPTINYDGNAWSSNDRFWLFRVQNGAQLRTVTTLQLISHAR